MQPMIYPYNSASESARDLGKALGIKRISHNNSRFVGQPDRVVINWGASKLPEEVSKCLILNRPEAVAIASNKLDFFRRMRGHTQIVPFTTSERNVEDWIAMGCEVVARTVLNGHSGEGIVLFSNMDDFVEAPLYTMYIPKKHEFRIHVFRGEVVDAQRKARRRDVPDDQINWKIRNHDNGFVFARNEEFVVPECVHKQAIRAVTRCGLDFGAVDVIYNQKEETAYVLEVNTAPGLSGETLAGYTRRLEVVLKEIEEGIFVAQKEQQVNPFIIDDMAKFQVQRAELQQIADDIAARRKVKIPKPPVFNWEDAMPVAKEGEANE